MNIISSSGVKFFARGRRVRLAKSKHMRLRNRPLGSPSFCGQCLRNNMFYRIKFSARFLFEILLLMVHMHVFFGARLHE